MSVMKKTVAGSVLCLGMVMGAQAHEAGDVLLRFGAANVQPQEDSSTVTLNGAAALGSAAEVGVEDDTQLGLTMAYMLTDNIGVELLAASPFEHDIYANGQLSGALGIHKVGSTKELPPTLSVQYYFNNSSALTPYVGVGLNYTAFFSEDTSGEFDAAVGGSSDLSVDDSWGLAGQLGADYAINDHWMLNAAVWYLDIDTDADIKTPLGKVAVDVQVDPFVYLFGLGYTF